MRRATHRIGRLAAGRTWLVVSALSLSALVPGLVLAGPARANTAPVSVFPVAGSRVASPSTQITFRGVAASQIGAVTVTGSRSGAHSGRLAPDSDGQGASFLPASPFTPGEVVTVHTGLNATGAQNGTYTFTVATPAGGIPPSTRVTASRAPGDVTVFHSRRDLVPAAVKVVQNSRSAVAGDIFVAPQWGPYQDGPMILDRAGNLVWFHPLPSNTTATDFRVQTYHGQPVLTWWQGNLNGAGVGNGADVMFDNAYRQIATVRAGNGLTADLHEFELSPQGTALITAYYPVYWDATSVHGSRRQIVLDSVVQEIDIPTGLVLFQWDSLDHIPLAASYAALPKAGTRNPFDYFHVNAVQQDTDGNLVVSARNTWATYKLSHQTGAVLWQLGGKTSTFSMGPGTGTAFQHHSRVRPGGLLTVFDDGGGPPQVHAQARALLETLDQNNHKVVLQRAFAHSPALHVNFEGSTQLLAGGDVFVGWGQQPYFTEFSPQGAQIFDARFVGGNSSYRAFKYTWAAQPPTPPAVAAVAGSAGQATVYASWNGATTVASWRVMAGPSPAALRPVATAPKSGFETAIPVKTDGPYVAVQALGSGGQTLATSSAAAIQSRVAVFGTTGFVSSSGVAGVLLACFGRQSCTGSLTVTVGGTVLGRRQSETVAADDGGMVHVTLTPGARSALAHARNKRLPVRVTIDDGGGEWTTTVITLVPFTTTGAAPPTSAVQSRTIRTFASTAFAAHQGVGAIFLGCFAAQSCRGRMTISSGGTLVATRTQTIGAQDGGVAHFSMTRAGESLLAHARGNQLPIQVKVADAGGDTATATLNLVGFQ